MNIDTTKQEIQEDVDRLDDTKGKINPYHEIIVNKAERDDTILSQMEQWSILSNAINYDSHLRNIYKLDITAIDQKFIRRCIIKKRKHKN